MALRVAQAAALAAAAALAGSSITGCADQLPVSGPPSESRTTSSSPPPRLAPRVLTPLDARDVKACDLLSSAQLRELKLNPATAAPKTVGISDNCAWDSTDDPGSVGGVQLSTHPTLPVLDGVYLVRDTFARFEPLEISGHPAVRADRTSAPSCTIYVGIADYQGVAVGADAAGRPVPDICASSRRMAEMILSNLPPLR